MTTDRTPDADRNHGADSPPDGAGLRIAVTGATGFLGSVLEPALTAAGYKVVRISRREPRPGSSDLQWDPSNGLLDAQGLTGVHGVIHLAGENIAQRWTDDARRRIRESRTQGTGLVARTIAGLDNPPPVLLSASAVGYYGARGDEELDEDSAPGSGFLAGVVQAWEASAQPAREAGVRVVHPRLGVLLGEGGGVLERLVPPFRLGLGGQVGDGQQWMSWIARSDAVAALLFLLQSGTLDGPVNVVAPEPVRNDDFTTALGHAVNRPTLGFVPAFALRAVYGQMAEETLLAGQRVRPARLQEAGFRFRHPEIEEALRAELAGD